MAEDVLRLAGFTEHVNYRKQTQVEGGTGRPDFTFDLPKGHVLYMDVKFPLASYLRYLEVGTDAERQAHLKRFLADVRLRVKELAKRDYAREGDRPAVDYVLLFLPNEQLTGFIHEHDPALLDDAMGQRVVMCSPLTLFAFLGVIRQAFDNFMIEQTSDEILALIGKFGQQWQKYTESVEKVKRHFDSVAAGVRPAGRHPPAGRSSGRCSSSRTLRVQRNLPVDGELFADDADVDNVDDELGDAAERPARARRLTRDAIARPAGMNRRHDPAGVRLRRRAARRPGQPDVHGRRARRRASTARCGAAFSDGVWVRGEIQGWSERGGHAYFALADDSPGRQAVRPRAVLRQRPRCGCARCSPSTACASPTA